MRIVRSSIIATSLTAALLCPCLGWAQTPQSQPARETKSATNPKPQKKSVESQRAEEAEQPTKQEEAVEKEIDVDDFFNIREANPDVERGEFEFEFGVGWFEGGGNSDVTATAELNYGITD